MAKSHLSIPLGHDIKVKCRQLFYDVGTETCMSEYFFQQIIDELPGIDDEVCFGCFSSFLSMAALPDFLLKCNPAVFILLAAVTLLTILSWIRNSSASINRPSLVLKPNKRNQAFSMVDPETELMEKPADLSAKEEGRISSLCQMNGKVCNV